MPTLAQILGMVGAVPTWEAGQTVSQWDYRRSPLDGEVYQRKTATGSGTTDPADDTTNYVAVAYARATARPATSTREVAAHSSGIIASVYVTVDAISAGTRTNILAATGRGSCSFLAWQANMGTANGRLEIVVDGRTIYDATQTMGTATTHRWCQIPVGSLINAGAAAFNFLAIPDGAPLVFRRTFDVWFTPSTTTSTGNQLWHAVRGET